MYIKVVHEASVVSALNSDIAFICDDKYLETYSLEVQVEDKDQFAVAATHHGLSSVDLVTLA